MKEEHDERRINFNKLFHLAMKEDMDNNGIASAIIGDMNVTPTKTDSNIRMRGGNQTSMEGMIFPSFREYERKALRQLTATLSLVDAWKNLNVQSQMRATRGTKVTRTEE